MAAAELFRRLFLRGLSEVTPADRHTLITIAWSEPVVGGLLDEMLTARRRLFWDGVPSYLLLVLSSILYIAWGFSGHAILLGFAVLVYGSALALSRWALRRNRSYVVFRRLIPAIRAAGKALGTPPASAERQALVRAILRSSRGLGLYRPLIGVNLGNRILRDSVRHASDALRDLVPAALLGTEGDLRQVRDDLGRAAIRVGAGHWVEVAQLRGGEQRSRRADTLAVVWSGLRTTFVAILIPAVPVLLSALFGQ